MSCQRRCVLVVLGLSTIAALETLPAGPSSLAAAQGTSAKIWVGRYQEIEDYLRTGECLTVEKLGSETSTAFRCVLRPGGPVARMAWKPLPPGIYRGFFSSYKTEIAAYELDRLLKLDMVPPTVERQLQGNTGAAILWVENIATWKGDAPPGEANRRDWDKQLARMAMFAGLTGDQDRNLANVLRDGDWNLILIDHTAAFRLATTIPRPLRRIDGDYWDRVLALTRQELDARLRPWLDENQITAILDRRERMKAEVARLIAEKGEAAVVLR